MSERPRSEGQFGNDGQWVRESSPVEDEQSEGEIFSADEIARRYMRGGEPTLPSVYWVPARPPFPREPDEGVVAVCVIDGKEKPGWAFRAGQKIVRTHYAHDERLVKVYVEYGARP